MIARRSLLGGLAAGLGLSHAARGATMLHPVARGPYPRVQGGWLIENAPAGTRRLGYLPDAHKAVGAVTLETPGVVPVGMAADGAFFLGFDRDSSDQGLLIMQAAGGTRVLPYTIAPRHWPIENIDAPFHPPAVPDEAFARLRATELARIEAARAHDTGAQGWRQDFVWPVHGRISGRFGAQRIYRGTPAAYHSGLDIAPGAGATYVAPAEGVVVLAADAPFSLEGNLLIVDHGMGLNSAFLHAQRLLVREGDRVAQGQPLGLVGMTGRATGPHLHWSLRWREARLDPLLILPGMAGA